MTYQHALNQARKQGAAQAKDDALLAQTVSVVCLPHPGLTPEMVYNGARKQGLDSRALMSMGGSELDDLMWT